MGEVKILPPVAMPLPDEHLFAWQEIECDVPGIYDLSQEQMTPFRP
jgi:hypothetical protein